MAGNHINGRSAPTLKKGRVPLGMAAQRTTNEAAAVEGGAVV